MHAALQNSSVWLSIANEDDEKQKNFLTGTYYKDNPVAVKKIDKKTVEPNRDVLLELKQVKLFFITSILKHFKVLSTESVLLENILFLCIDNVNCILFFCCLSKWMPSWWLRAGFWPEGIFNMAVFPFTFSWATCIEKCLK